MEFRNFIDVRKLVEERIDELERISIKDVLSELGVEPEQVEIEGVEGATVSGVQELEQIAKQVEGMDIPNNPKQALLAEINAAILSQTVQIPKTVMKFSQFGALVSKGLHLPPKDVKLEDENYFLTGVEVMSQILKASRSYLLTYTPDACDCDDITEFNSNFATANFGLNTVGQVDVALFAFEGFTMKLLGLHACNAPVLSDKTVRIYEGELGCWVTNGVLPLQKGGKTVWILYVPFKAYYY